MADGPLGDRGRPDHAGPEGAFHWAKDPAGRPAAESLVTGDASTYLSLRNAAALAEACAAPVPDWELAASSLRHALDHHPELYTPKDRHAMDWYYPVLGGILPRQVAAGRLDARWEQFVCDGLGVRCVHDHPWVTGAETCELVLALDVIGCSEQARSMLGSMQHLRDDDGSYWTGLVYRDGKRWPVEQSTWTAATVLLAVDALSATTADAGLFRGEGLPACDLKESCTCPTG